MQINTSALILVLLVCFLYFIVQYISDENTVIDSHAEIEDTVSASYYQQNSTTTTQQKPIKRDLFLSLIQNCTKLLLEPKITDSMANVKSNGSNKDLSNLFHQLAIFPGKCNDIFLTCFDQFFFKVRNGVDLVILLQITTILDRTSKTTLVVVNMTIALDGSILIKPSIT